MYQATKQGVTLVWRGLGVRVSVSVFFLGCSLPEPASTILVDTHFVVVVIGSYYVRIKKGTEQNRTEQKKKPRHRHNQKWTPRHRQRGERQRKRAKQRPYIPPSPETQATRHESCPTTTTTEIKKETRTADYHPTLVLVLWHHTQTPVCLIEERISPSTTQMSGVWLLSPYHRSHVTRHITRPSSYLSTSKV